MGSVRVSEIPSDFLPLMVRDEDKIVCYGHAGVPIALGFELTDDAQENQRRAEKLRYIVWWYVEMVQRGIDPEIGGTA